MLGSWSVPQVWKICSSLLALAFSGMFSGHWISDTTSRKRDLVVQLSQLIFESSFVQVTFVFVMSFLLWYFMCSPADNLVPLSYSHCAVLWCFQFAWKIIHANNSPLFMSYLPKSCWRATQYEPYCQKASVYIKACSDLPAMNSNEFKAFRDLSKISQTSSDFLNFPSGHIGHLCLW